jgi:hypothetical protein
MDPPLNSFRSGLLEARLRQEATAWERTGIPNDFDRETAATPALIIVLRWRHVSAYCQKSNGMESRH